MVIALLCFKVRCSVIDLLIFSRQQIRLDGYDILAGNSNVYSDI